MPGIYEVDDGCSGFEVHWEGPYGYQTHGKITFCVIWVTVNPDFTMTFGTTWLSEWSEKSNFWPNKHPDTNNGSSTRTRTWNLAVNSRPLCRIELSRKARPWIIP
jgi:hypothetical protein